LHRLYGNIEDEIIKLVLWLYYMILNNAFFLHYKHQKSRNRKKKLQPLRFKPTIYHIIFNVMKNSGKNSCAFNKLFWSETRGVHKKLSGELESKLLWHSYARIERFAWNERKKASNYNFFIKFHSDDYISHSNWGFYLAGIEHTYISISIYFFIEDNIIKRYTYWETLEKNSFSEVHSLCSMIRHYNMKDCDLRFCAKQWIYWFYNDGC